MSIIAGGKSAESGLVEVMLILARDPDGFNAKINEYLAAEAKAKAAFELLAKAEEIPGLHEAAKKLEHDARVGIVAAEAKAQDIMKAAEEKAAKIISNAEALASVANDGATKAEDRIKQVQANMAELGKIRESERAKFEQWMADERNAIAEKWGELNALMEATAKAQAEAESVRSTFTDKLERIGAIAAE